MGFVLGMLEGVLVIVFATEMQSVMLASGIRNNLAL